MHFFNFFYPRDCLRANAFFCNGSNFWVSLRKINTDKQPTTDLINVLVFPKGTCKPYDDTITVMDLKEAKVYMATVKLKVRSDYLNILLSSYICSSKLLVYS